MVELTVYDETTAPEAARPHLDAAERRNGFVSTLNGVLCLTGPTGIAVFLLTPVWLVVTGIVLYRRLTASSPAASHSVRAGASV